jgi:hypothetical protein
LKTAVKLSVEEPVVVWLLADISGDNLGGTCTGTPVVVEDGDRQAQPRGQTVTTKHFLGAFLR